MPTSHSSLLTNPRFWLCFLSLWFLLLWLSPATLDTIKQYAVFSALGVVGAIFANSTGAGGGVIFVPLFNQLNFTELQSVATSFGIQSFGMTAGALTWWFHYKKDKLDLRLWRGFKRIIATTTCFSVIGIWFIFITELSPPASLHTSFSWFSLILGVFIIFTVYLIKPKRESSFVSFADYIALAVIGFIGGVLTAWLSVGVGELLAIYLILRRFDVTMAVAAAVIVSAISVWSAIAEFTLINFTVVWQVVIFAGPCAILGGIWAKTLVTLLSATRLKLFFAFWLLVVGVSGI